MSGPRKLFKLMGDILRESRIKRKEDKLVVETYL